MTTNATGTLVAKAELHRGSSRSTCTTDARLAHNARQKRNKTLRRLGRPTIIDATGTHRRLRALMANGWRAKDLAPRIGWRSGELDTIFRRPTVYRRTADAVARVYDELADYDGPSEQTRRRAARAGWLPPLWWDADTIDDPTYTPPTREPARPRKTDVDPVRVDRAIAGQPVDLTRAERLDAVRQLRARHLGYDAIADRLRVAARQVHRDLTDLGLVHAEAGAA